MKYDARIVTKFFQEHGIEPVLEYKFHDKRKWRFDFAWPEHKLALECQGAIFTNGRHTRGAALLKEHEKLNEAARLGWRVMFTTPTNLCMGETIEMLKDALGINGSKTSTR
jgi:hypothetical protein